MPYSHGNKQILFYFRAEHSRSGVEGSSVNAVKLSWNNEVEFFRVETSWVELSSVWCIPGMIPPKFFLIGFLWDVCCLLQPFLSDVFCFLKSGAVDLSWVTAVPFSSVHSMQSLQFSFWNSEEVFPSRAMQWEAEKEANLSQSSWKGVLSQNSHRWTSQPMLRQNKKGWVYSAVSL